MACSVGCRALANSPVCDEYKRRETGTGNDVSCHSMPKSGSVCYVNFDGQEPDGPGLAGSGGRDAADNSMSFSPEGGAAT